MTKLTHLMLEGNYEEARKIHFRLLPLMQAISWRLTPARSKQASL